MRPSTAIGSSHNRITDNCETIVGCSLKEYKKTEELGKGAYGTVYKVLCHRDNNIYVLKKIPINHMKKLDIKDVVKEAKILRKVEHKNIIRSYAHFIEDDALNIIMEYAEKGDLQKVCTISD